jgi:AcrR family transcriptional regulator
MRPRKRSSRRRLPRGTLSSDQILDAASEIAASVGLQALTMPEVANQLGVKVTSLYWYFRTKEELLVALVERISRQFHEALDERLDDDKDLDSEEVVLRHFLRYFQWLQLNPLWHEVILIGLGRPGGASAKAIAFGHDTYRRVVAHAVDAGFDRADSVRVSMVIYAYTRGYLRLQDLQEEDYAVRPELTDVWTEAELYETLNMNREDTFEIGLRALWAGLSANLQGDNRRGRSQHASVRKHRPIAKG